MNKTTTQLTPVIRKHYFRQIDATEERQFAAFAPTPAEAQKQFSQNGTRYVHTTSETIPYKYIEIAQAIAAALPGAWTATPQSEEYPECNWDLRRADGLTLYLSSPSYDHRTQFRFGLSAPRHNGSWVEPYNENGNRVASPVIGCGIAKTPAQMAKDIERRLLADAERVNGYVFKRIEVNQKSEDAQVASLRAVCAAFGKSPSKSYNNPGKLNFSLPFESGSFEVHGGGSVSFKLYSVDADKAVTIAKALRRILG